jgi:hypothetical protein
MWRPPALELGDHLIHHTLRASPEPVASPAAQPRWPSLRGPACVPSLRGPAWTRPASGERTGTSTGGGGGAGGEPGAAAGCTVVAVPCRGVATRCPPQPPNPQEPHPMQHRDPPSPTPPTQNSRAAAAAVSPDPALSWGTHRDEHRGGRRRGRRAGRGRWLHRGGRDLDHADLASGVAGHVAAWVSPELVSSCDVGTELPALALGPAAAAAAAAAAGRPGCQGLLLPSPVRTCVGKPETLAYNPKPLKQ